MKLIFAIFLLFSSSRIFGQVFPHEADLSDSAFIRREAFLPDMACYNEYLIDSDSLVTGSKRQKAIHQLKKLEKRYSVIVRLVVYTHIGTFYQLDHSNFSVDCQLSDKAIFVRVSNPVNELDEILTNSPKHPKTKKISRKLKKIGSILNTVGN